MLQPCENQGPEASFQIPRIAMSRGVYLCVRIRSMKRGHAIFGTSRLLSAGMLSSIILFASFRTSGDPCSCAGSERRMGGGIR